MALRIYFSLIHSTKSYLDLTNVFLEYFMNVVKMETAWSLRSKKSEKRKRQIKFNWNSSTIYFLYSKVFTRFKNSRTDVITASNLYLEKFLIVMSSPLLIKSNIPWVSCGIYSKAHFLWKKAWMCIKKLIISLIASMLNLLVTTAWSSTLKRSN